MLLKNKEFRFFNSLRFKLTVATSIIAAIIFGVVVAFSVVTGREKAINAAKVEFYEKAKRVSLLLKATIDNSFSILQTQNRILKTLDNKGKLNRTTSLDIVRSNLSGNKDYVGMCVMFEPNSLCVNDTSLGFLMDKNVFIPYLYYDTEGNIAIEPLMDYDIEGVGDYYLIPRQTKRPLLTEPFFYPINGEDVFMVTLSEPIIQNDRFLGITTIDYAINFIQSLCQDLVMEVNNGNAKVAVISHRGIIVANSADSSMIGKSIMELYSDEVNQQFKSILEGKEEIHFHDGFLILDMPVLFSETQTPWRLHVAVPQSDILAEARQQTRTLIFIGILLIYLAVLMINILTGNLTKPLFKLVENTKKIAEGNLTVDIKTKQKDEVGVLTDSFNSMVIRLREMIDALQNSIKQVEAKNIELADKEEKFRKLFEEASDAIFLLDENGYFFDSNQTASDYFNLTKEELIGKTVLDLSPEYQAGNITSAEKATDLLNKTLNNKPQRCEWEHLNRNGKAFTVSVSLKKICLSGTSYVQAIIRDITKKKQKDRELEMHRNHLEKLVSEKTRDLKTAYEELKETNAELNEKNEIIYDQNQELKSTLQHLKETQTQLLHSEKMASLGILTAGVAHEINNPLNIIMGAHTGLLHHLKNKSFTDNHEEIEALINALKIGVERSSAIVRGLNQFSRKSDSYDEDCDLHAIINNSLAMLHNQMKHHITVKREFFASDIIIKGNVGNMHQVFINLLNNAVQAIENEGEITIKTNYLKQDAIIEIRDTGHGISPENLEKVTVPFFTTKDPGKGTGLGLSITYNIIMEHKAKLEFESEPGKGTTVKVLFPNAVKQTAGN